MGAYINYGIDLGTTNSCVARWQGDDVRVYQNNDHMLVTPSVVRITKKGRTFVGQKARNAAASDPDNTAFEFKRWVGNSDRIEFPASGRSMSAEELSAEVLKSLVADVRRQEGEDVGAAVIGVPAAFGTQQCEATARAARLAGITEFHLLQEPIAASIAYGVEPGAENQRWLVFDLGGGTFDVAVVSTRKGRLTVLEHRGHNQLGGKDIDRKVAENHFLPVLAEEFALPEEGDPAYDRILRRLLLIAEDAKIYLSTSEEYDVPIMDVGKDQEGTQIELEIPLSMNHVLEETMPLLDDALGLADEALAAARISGNVLDRILLVGGPTQMPAIREALANHFGTKVDHSLDPMTVVARGASIYASATERTTTAGVTAAPQGALAAQLAFEPVSASLQCPVAGRLEGEAAAKIVEIKVDAEGGYWTSGWCPLEDGEFEVDVRLREGRTTRFWLYVRDASGRLHNIEQGEFNVRHGLEVAAAPLPKSIAIELDRPDGKPEFVQVVPRSTPLPAEVTKRYRTARRLEPGEMGGALPIKLWEGEALSDPEANTFLGNVDISSAQIARTIPQGEEIELFVRIDASRIITVEASVPRLNMDFGGRVYRKNEPSARDQAKALPEELGKLNEKLDELEAQLPSDADPETREELGRLRQEVHDGERAATTMPEDSVARDPDRGKRLVERTREIRSQIGALERKAGVSDKAKLAAQLEERAADAVELAIEAGSPLDAKEAEALRRRLDRALAKGDERGAQQASTALDQLRYRVLFKQPWFWREVFEAMPHRDFIDQAEAKRWLDRGQEAIEQGDVDGLKEAVRHLWDLTPGDAEEEDKQRVLRSGLRRF